MAYFLHSALPSSKIPRTLAKACVDKAKLLLVASDGKQWEKKKNKWASLPKKLAITKPFLPDVPLYRLDPTEALLPTLRWRTSMCIIKGKNVSVLSKDILYNAKKLVMKHNKRWGKKEMMKKIAEVQESKQQEVEVPRLAVKEVLKENPK